MPKKKTIYCTNRGVGRLLTDAISGALSEPGREEDRHVFFDQHLDECRSCRDEMIDHANQLALDEIADENGTSVDEVMVQLGRTAKQLRDIARDQGMPFEEVVLATLRGLMRTSAISKPDARYPSSLR
jgi:predicted anti-sigma-YlaC factor YlaD